MPYLNMYEQIGGETQHTAMTHPANVNGTNVERAQSPSGPILAASTTDAKYNRIPPKKM
jgi:hypothetical protein